MAGVWRARKGDAFETVVYVQIRILRILRGASGFGYSRRHGSFTRCIDGCTILAAGLFASNG
jgi:hypothetical protein